MSLVNNSYNHPFIHLKNQTSSFIHTMTFLFLSFSLIFLNTHTPPTQWPNKTSYHPHNAQSSSHPYQCPKSFYIQPVPPDPSGSPISPARWTCICPCSAPLALSLLFMRFLCLMGWDRLVGWFVSVIACRSEWFWWFIGLRRVWISPCALA